MTDAPADSTHVGLKRLERELRVARRHGAKAIKQMHAALVADVRRAERRAEKAETEAAEAIRRARQAERRARRAEAELVEIRSSRTWKTGRAVLAAPARIRRLGRW
ncbi:MAG: hypothetical protein M3445_05850 [Actinomycetota bacterium]|nr:hypothetical protein [Actinomycetota bacterium]